MKKLKRLLLGSALGIWALQSFLNDTAFFLYTFPTKYPNDKLTQIYENKISHRKLEELLGFELYGRYPDKFAEELLTYTFHINKINPELITHARKVVWIDENHNTKYEAKHVNFMNINCGKIVLKSSFNLMTFAHELAHAKHCSMPVDFYSKWAQISFGTHRYWNLFGFFIKSNDKDDYPTNGIVTYYGSKNPKEDLAELIEDSYNDFNLLCSSTKDNHKIFRRKITLLREEEFLSQKQYEKAFNCLI